MSLSISILLLGYNRTSRSIVLDCKAIAETVAREMGLLLGWGEGKRQSEIDTYRALTTLRRRFTEQGQ
jgi:hypothetical protein